MRTVLNFAQQLPTLLRAELEQILASLASFWDREHHADGTHAVITPDRGLFDDGTALLPSVSFSSDPKLLGAPRDFELPVRDVRLASGAEFVIVYCGDIMTMPGLPRAPAALHIDVDDDGRIRGLF